MEYLEERRIKEISNDELGAHVRFQSTLLVYFTLL
jgi:hypothetical protein